MDEIKTITLEDKNYPKLLKEIKDPPEVLYYIGTLPKPDENCFAVVGTRRYSLYGKQVALEIASDLAEAGLTIVSGLAPGIDSFTHQAAVERNKRTIAILGTGLDEKSIYPQSNLKLARKILETGGCLISEYPPETPGSKFTFPQRNRIISGLSLGVLVVEAKQKSGALITAHHAFKQNRKVFAVPGSIYSSNSKGCHYLIKKGAKLVETANDILLELNLPEITKSGLVTGENKEENLILEVLKKEALYIDKIIEKTKLNAATVASTLAILEIKGKVRNLGGNVYATNSG
ncbi:MAG: DNA-processing protein DprA [Patescibacteria group bacterium]|nr:DNA-processing protein DprA [Patescibacteria group bacterium]